jgi:hypothetical protein
MTAIEKIRHSYDGGERVISVDDQTFQEYMSGLAAIERLVSEKKNDDAKACAYCGSDLIGSGRCDSCGASKLVPLKKRRQSLMFRDARVVRSAQDA